MVAPELIVNLSIGATMFLGVVVLFLLIVWTVYWSLEYLFRITRITVLLVDYYANRKAYKEWKHGRA